MILLNNIENKGPAYSRYRGIQLCHPEEICIFLDGDDFIINSNVLQILKENYKKKEIYATFGGTRGEKPLPFCIYKRNQKKQLYFPHLRTVRGWVCKLIPSTHLKYGDRWFPFCTDIAFFLCVVEIIDNKYCFSRHDLVEYNTHNARYNKITGYVGQTQKYKKQRKKYEKYIRQQPSLHDFFCKKKTLDVY